MTTPGTPVAQLRQLRTVLRKEREARGLTQKAVADALDWSTSKVIRIEKGPVGISVTDLKALLLQYRVTDEHRVDELVSMARRAKQPGWWDEYRAYFRPQFISFLGLEASSIRIRQLQNLTVPGLLQTAGYARNVLMASYTNDPERTDRGVTVRLRRQEILESEETEFFFVLDESVLLRQVGDAEVMREQLRHLVELAARPNISIQILPFSAGRHRAMNSSFEIFELSEEDNDYAMISERPLQDELYDEPSPETREYVQMFMELEHLALPVAESVQLIEKVIAQTGGVS
ncbi:MAG TPA: helix-turn-helix transcriptional regulator [Pseudonocardiaceae bacterium]|jgi:transcriptional regulator with XRE-family HTH domain|nr:helix-turn-helix transcriptional regulator [Pseudonocardiaceae bacterium]